jgi:hypothetical protein
MATLTPIEKLQRHAKRIANGNHERVKPGMPFRITEAASVGDGVWQGDLGLEIVADVPAEYTLIEKPKDIDRQLVPGNTQGAKHCMDSLDGVTLYRPHNWNAESMVGPCLVLSQERTVLHPTHGPVTIPAGFTVQCRYQREFDAEQRRERRARD